MRVTTTTTKAIAVLLVGLFFTPTGSAGSVTLAGAEQQVGLRIASKTVDEDDHTLIEEYSPFAPKGLGDAEFNVSHAYPDYSISASASLTSSFEPNKVTANGSAAASSAWVSPPSNATDVHAGSRSTFRLYLSTGSTPADLRITGNIHVHVSDPTRHPEETYVYMKLSVAGGSVIWEKSLDGRDAGAAEAVDQDVLLPAGQNYVLEALAEGATGASVEHPGSNSSTASFHVAASLNAPVSPPGCPEGSPTDGTNDLAGTWYIHSLASGPVGRWWEYGRWTISTDYSFRGVVNEYKKAPAEISGKFLLAPNGVATFVGASQDPDAAILPHLHMAANKSVIAGVTTWTAGFPGTTQMMLLTRHREVTRCQTWRGHGTFTRSPRVPGRPGGSMAL